jgi:hypothetical protein
MAARIFALWSVTVFLSMALFLGCQKLGDSGPIQQPIAFSHKIHAGDNQIPCLYCHTYADRSRVAGIPAVETCMGCHKIVGLDKPEVQKIHDYWNKKEPIPWKRVHDLQDFVYFSHKRHVKAGVACENCHGQIAQMDVVEQVSSLQMGWCVTCHESRAQDKEQLTVLKDCATCHQ